MSALFVVLGLVVVASVSIAAAGGLGELPEAPPDRRPAEGEPEFDVVLRGYRMDEVDATIAGLREENARLRAERA